MYSGKGPLQHERSDAMLNQKRLPEAYERKSTFLRRAVSGIRGELSSARFATRPLPRVRFVIFAQGRTGSTLLTSTLNTHSQITCMDEILSAPRVAPIRFVSHAARRSGAPCFGFHVKIYQLLAWQRVKDPASFLQKMHMCGWKIVYLWRENLLEQVVSNIFAEASGRYHFWSGDRADRLDRVHVCTRRLLESMDSRDRCLGEEGAALRGVPHLKLNYERDLRSPETQPATFRRLQGHLEVDPEDISPRIQKSVRKPVADLIKNYTEVREALAGTRFERFLTETQAERSA